MQQQSTNSNHNYFYTLCNTASGISSREQFYWGSGMIGAVTRESISQDEDGLIRISVEVPDRPVTAIWEFWWVALSCFHYSALKRWEWPFSPMRLTRSLATTSEYAVELRRRAHHDYAIVFMSCSMYLSKCGRYALRGKRVWWDFWQIKHLARDWQFLSYCDSQGMKSNNYIFRITEKTL